MNPFPFDQALWSGALGALTLAAFAVPLAPAVIELRRRRDAAPLVVDPDHDATARYAVDYALRRDGSTWKETDLNIEPHRDVSHAVTFRSVAVGPEARVRDAVGGDVVRLRRGSRVDGVALAIDALHVAPDCRFAWLDAPVVRFGDAEGGASDAAPAVARKHPARRSYQVLPGHFRRHAGDRTVAPGEASHGDYVVTGDLRIGAGAVVAGHVKVYGSVTVEDDASVWGNIFAEGDIALGPRAFVAGVVSAARRVTLGPASVVGVAGRLTSVAAAEVVAHPGATVHGSVRAHREGRSVSADLAAAVA